MEQDKSRLDILMVDKGFVESREKARALIMSGVVYVNGTIIDKSGTKISKTSEIEIKGKQLGYVSRGGLKLAKAIEYFSIDVSGMIAADIGASTGGFTDCLLQNNASKVYSIDVGYGQLAWKLRNDSRVVTMERTNIRYVTPEMLQDKIDFATIDVSFISLTKVLPVVIKLLSDNGQIVCLIKPQFEAGKGKVGKKGVVKDPNIHKEVISTVSDFCINELCMTIIGLTYSPIKGPEGNIEYLLYIAKSTNPMEMAPIEELIDSVVSEAHFYLK